MGLDFAECWCRILRFSRLGHQSLFDWAPAVVRAPCIAANGHFASLDMVRSSSSIPFSLPNVIALAPPIQSVLRIDLIAGLSHLGSPGPAPGAPTARGHDLDPGSQLDHCVGRQPEVLRHAAGVAAHRGKQPLAPVRHAAPRRRHHGLSTQEVGGPEDGDVQAVRPRELERLRHVRNIHEPEVHRHAPEAVAERRDLHAPVHRHPRHFVEGHGQDHVALVQHLVVLEVVQQRLWHGGRIGHCVDRGALSPAHRARVQRIDEGLQCEPVPPDALQEKRPATPPGAHDAEQHQAKRQGEPAAIEELHGAARDQQRVDGQEEGRRSEGQRRRQPPDFAHDEVGQHRRDHHRQRHRDAIGAGQRRGAAEEQHGSDDAGQQRPVDRRHVDLPDFPGINPVRRRRHFGRLHDFRHLPGGDQPVERALRLLDQGALIVGDLHGFGGRCPGFVLLPPSMERLRPPPPAPPFRRLRMSVWPMQSAS